MQKQKQRKSIVLGLTGSFGSGKSTVAGIFKSFGAKLIDADKLAHECVSPGKRAYKKIWSLVAASH
jgi:dephospho-CoA kinase